MIQVLLFLAKYCKINGAMKRTANNKHFINMN